jgi:hypothetical protein
MNTALETRQGEVRVSVADGVNAPSAGAQPELVHIPEDACQGRLDM